MKLEIQNLEKIYRGRKGDVQALLAPRQPRFVADHHPAKGQALQDRRTDVRQRPGRRI